MGLVEKATIVARLSPPLDKNLCMQLVDEFTSMEQRFIQRDWEPAELDGGQFGEILGRILYHTDSGNLNPNKDFNECLDWVEDPRNQHKHEIDPRRDALHLAKVLRTVYRFRSQRGAVHISPTYKPNHMDAKLVIEGVRWCMNETMRKFWQGDREKVAKAIRELLQFDVPCVGVYEGVLLVQRTDLTPEEELLVLLHYAGEAGFDRRALGTHCMATAVQVTRAIQSLTAPNCRQVVQLGGGAYALTGLGAKRIREHLSEKLLLQ